MPAETVCADEVVRTLPWSLPKVRETGAKYSRCELAARSGETGMLSPGLRDVLEVAMKHWESCSTQMLFPAWATKGWSNRSHGLRGSAKQGGSHSGHLIL